MPMCLGRKRTKKQRKTAALGGGDPRKKTSALGGGDPRGEARHFGNATIGIGLFAMNGISTRRKCISKVTPSRRAW